MRIAALITMVLGLAALALGVIFLFNATSAEDQIAESIAPLALNEVNGKYDVVAAKYDAIKMMEEPAIQAQTAAPSDMYNYLSSQRALLGLAKANIGTAKVIRLSGIVDIVVGLGLVITGIALFRKNG